MDIQYFKHYFLKTYLEREQYFGDQIYLQFCQQHTFSSCSYPRVQATRIYSIFINGQFASWILKIRGKNKINSINCINHNHYRKRYIYTNFHLHQTLLLHTSQNNFSPGSHQGSTPTSVKDSKDQLLTEYTKHIYKKKCISKGYFI